MRSIYERQRRTSQRPLSLTAKVKLTDDSEPTVYALLLSEAACYLLCQVLQKVL